MLLAVALVMVVVAILLWPSDVIRDLGQTPSATTDSSTERTEQRPGRAATHTQGVQGDVVTVEAAADALVLCALALRAGLGPVESLEAVAARVPGAVGHQLRVVASAHRWGQDAATAWGHVGDGWQSASLAWQAAERSGAAPAGVVLAAAERMRRQESSRVEKAVQRAGVLLVLPLGACFLPGFVATTVVPVVLHLAGAGFGGAS